MISLIIRISLMQRDNKTIEYRLQCYFCEIKKILNYLLREIRQFSTLIYIKMIVISFFIDLVIFLILLLEAG